MEKQFCVYILASAKRGTLYIGVTSNLVQRVVQHREKVVEGFTARYGIDRLVWYEVHHEAGSAILPGKAVEKMESAVEDPAGGNDQFRLA